MSKSRSETNRRTTWDHDEIRDWAEERGGRPARVKNTGGEGDVGMIRIDFADFSGEDSLEEITWDAWFEAFDANQLALVVQDTTANGGPSNFNQLVAREGSESGGRRRGRGSARSTSVARPQEGGMTAKRRGHRGKDKDSNTMTMQDSSRTGSSRSTSRSGSRSTSGSTSGRSSRSSASGGGTRSGMSTRRSSSSSSRSGMTSASGGSRRRGSTSPRGRSTSRSMSGMGETRARSSRSSSNGRPTSRRTTGARQSSSRSRSSRY